MKTAILWVGQAGLPPEFSFAWICEDLEIYWRFAPSLFFQTLEEDMVVYQIPSLPADYQNSEWYFLIQSNFPQIFCIHSPKRRLQMRINFQFKKYLRALQKEKILLIGHNSWSQNRWKKQLWPFLDLFPNSFEFTPLQAWQNWPTQALVLGMNSHESHRRLLKSSLLKHHCVRLL